MTTLTAFDPLACLDALDAHRRAFQISSPYPLEQFTAMVRRADDCTLECSVKIDGDSLYPARFNLWFQDEHRPSQVAQVFGFFRDVEGQPGVTIGYQLFHQFYSDGFDWSRVQAFVTGVDLRSAMSDSRLKIWFKLGAYPEKIEAAFRLGRAPAHLRGLALEAGLLVGFDFYLDGRAAIKLYPRITGASLQRPSALARLRQILPATVVDAMLQCHWVHISLAADGVDRILHFRPSEPDGFLRRYVDHPAVHRVFARYRDIHVLDMVVSVPEADLLAGAIRSANLYFMVGRALALSRSVAQRVQLW